MTELLRCPFCGGEAETLTAESMHGGNLYGVMCANCAGRSDVYDTEAEAIAAWNSRAERTCKPVERDGVMRCPDCDYPLGIMSVPAYCAGCGAKVVGE